MRVMVIGSRGFMGSSVGRMAARAGHEVLGTSLSSQPEADWPGKHYRADASCADISPVIKDFAPDALFHAAGTASVGASFATPAEDLRIAMLTWSQTLDSVRRSGVRPVVFFPSSAAVYGEPSQLPISETAPIAPISPYGFHKAACELVAREYANCFGLDIVVCRFFSVFGARQRRLLVWELYRQFMGPVSTVWLEGTGTETRDYMSIEDICRVLVQCMEHLSLNQNHGEYLVLNVASGEPIKVLDLAHLIGEIAGRQKPVSCRGHERPGDPRHWQADISLLKTMFSSWKPTPFEKSLDRCLAAWRGLEKSGSFE